MGGRLLNLVTWLLVASSLAIITGGLSGRPILLAAVPTSSMEPTLHPGDLILVLPLMGRQLETGQIVVFKTERDQDWIVHRIVGGDQVSGFITRGDANQRSDPYRVFPRHVAGVVPVRGERAARISGLGALSLERGPLSSPYLAAVAMVLGIYLLASEEPVLLRRVRLTRRRRRTRGRAGVLAVYLALGLGVSLLTYLSVCSLSSRQAGRVEVVSERYPWSRTELLLVGERREERVILTNQARVPLIMGMSTSDPAVRWSPEWLFLLPGEEQEVTLSVEGITPGTRQVVLRQSVYLPFLPVAWLRALGEAHWHAPALATALVPLLFMAGTALTDRRLSGRLRPYWAGAVLRRR